MQMRDWGSRGRVIALLAVTVLAALGPGDGGRATRAAATDCTPVLHHTFGAPVALHRMDAVTAAGTGNVWAVGQSYTYDYSGTGRSGTVISTTSTLLHWVGTEWQAVASPDPGAVLGPVFAFGRRDTWLTASRIDPATGGGPPLIFHSDGIAWAAGSIVDLQGHPVRTGTVAALGGSSPADLWAVGSGIWHGSHDSWQAVPVRELPGGTLELRSVAASSRDAAWAVGTFQATGQTTGQNIMLHWNGVAWGPVTVPGIQPRTVAAVPGQAGAWVGGNGGSAHWDGQAWTTVPVPGLGAGFMSHIAVNKDGAAWATAEGYPNPGTPGSPSPALYHWDGRHWTLVPGSLDTPRMTYSSLTIEGPDNVWAVGTRGFDAPGGGSSAEIAHIFSPCGLPTAPVANPQADGVRYFPEVHHTLRGLFRAYWEAHGGLAQFGYPITEEYQEPNATDGQTYRVQYFQRNRFEYHPENAGTPYEVLLGLLGRSGGGGTAFQPLPSAPPGVRFFPQTGHTLAPELAAYWESQGGLAVYGYPISEPSVTNEPNKQPYIMQYFERNRLEYHPDFPPDFRVSLGLLGAELLHQRGWLP